MIKRRALRRPSAGRSLSQVLRGPLPSPAIHDPEDFTKVDSCTRLAARLVHNIVQGMPMWLKDQSDFRKRFNDRG